MSGNCFICGLLGRLVTYPSLDNFLPLFKSSDRSILFSKNIPEGNNTKQSKCFNACTNLGMGKLTPTCQEVAVRVHSLEKVSLGNTQHPWELLGRTRNL
jgi:hypothetical protein